MPLFPASPIFHSSSSSKSPNSSFDTMSFTGVVFASVPSTIFQPSGTASVLYPRQASSDLPSNSVFHGPGLAVLAGCAGAALDTSAPQRRKAKDRIIVLRPFQCLFALIAAPQPSQGGPPAVHRLPYSLR